MDNCPVCSKDSDNKELSSVVDGVVYYFCCKKCFENFNAEPRKYINCCEDKKEEDE